MVKPVWDSDTAHSVATAALSSLSSPGASASRTGTPLNETESAVGSGDHRGTAGEVGDVVSCPSHWFVLAGGWIRCSAQNGKSAPVSSSERSQILRVVADAWGRIAPLLGSEVSKLPYQAHQARKARTSAAAQARQNPSRSPAMRRNERRDKPSRSSRRRSVISRRFGLTPLAFRARQSPEHMTGSWDTFREVQCRCAPMWCVLATPRTRRPGSDPRRMTNTRSSSHRACERRGPSSPRRTCRRGLPTRLREQHRVRRWRASRGYRS